MYLKCKTLFIILVALSIHSIGQACREVILQRINVDGTKYPAVFDIQHDPKVTEIYNSVVFERSNSCTGTRVSYWSITKNKLYLDKIESYEPHPRQMSSIKIGDYFEVIEDTKNLNWNMDYFMKLDVVLGQSAPIHAIWFNGDIKLFDGKRLDGLREYERYIVLFFEKGILKNKKIYDNTISYIECNKLQKHHKDENQHLYDEETETKMLILNDKIKNNKLSEKDIILDKILIEIGKRDLHYFNKKSIPECQPKLIEEIDY